MRPVLAILAAALAGALLAGAALAQPASDAGPVTTGPVTTGPVTTAPAAVAPADPADALHAPAGVADCIWGQTPKPVRDQVESAASIDVVAAAIHSMGADLKTQLAIAEHCNVPISVANPADIVQHALEARTLEIWTRSQLRNVYGLTDARLSTAWARVTPAEKSVYAHWFGDRLQAPDEKLDTVQTLMDALGLTGDDAAAMVLYYAGSRSLYEQLGGTV